MVNDSKDLREYQRQAELERESLAKEREDLFNQLVTLERRFAECEQREVASFSPTFLSSIHLVLHAAVQNLQHTIAAAEEAKLQKEQSSIREQQISKENARVTGRFSSLSNELLERHAKEIEEYVRRRRE